MLYSLIADLRYIISSGVTDIHADCEQLLVFFCFLGYTQYTKLAFALFLSNLFLSKGRWWDFSGAAEQQQYHYYLDLPP